MKILIITQYFWPENFRINDLVGEMATYGHEVTILTGLPSYPKGEVFSDFLKRPNEFNEYKSSKIVRVPIITRGKSKLKLALNYSRCNCSRHIQQILMLTTCSCRFLI